MAELVPTSYGLCACGQSLPSAGAKRCPKCQAAHARKHIGLWAARLRQLPQIAYYPNETNWIACNLAFKHPDLATAPSQTAVSLLTAIKADVKLERAFWATYFKRRLKRPYG